MDDARPRRPATVKLIFGTILVGGSLILLGLGVPGVLGARADNALVAVEGVVMSVVSDRQGLWVRSNSPNAPTHENLITVSYAYTVDGVAYAGDTWAFDEPRESITNDAEAAQRLEALVDADGITVLYDPTDPSVSVLSKRELAPAAVVTVVGGVGVPVGGFLLWGWWASRRAGPRV
jgi:hypothetical protein